MQCLPFWATSASPVNKSFLGKGERETLKKANVRHFVVIARRLPKCHQESSSIRKCPEDRKTSRAYQCQLNLIGTLHVPMHTSHHLMCRHVGPTPLPQLPQPILPRSNLMFRRVVSDARAHMTETIESSAIYRRTDVSISRFQSMRRPATSRETSASWLSLTYSVALGHHVSPEMFD